jgi:hypothetical protein
MKHVRLASLVPEFAFAALLLSQASTVAASPPSPEAAVLSQEARWLTAIVNGDRKTITSILSTNFKHITARGKLLDRAQELASMDIEPFTMNATERCGCGSRIEHRHPVGQSAVARAVHRRVHQAKWQLDGAISTGNRDLAISLSRSASPKTNRCVGRNRASTLKYHYCITSQLLAARGLEADRKYQAAIAATMEDANSI